MWTEVSFSAPHLLHEGVFALLFCNIYCRLICPVRSSISNLQCFCLVHLWTEHTNRLIPPDIIGWSHTFHKLSIPSVSFFLSSFLFWTWICSRIIVGEAPDQQVWSWLPPLSVCGLVLLNDVMSRYSHYGYLVYFRQFATSSDFVPLAPRATTATWLSAQIVICSFTSLFLRQRVTQSSIAATTIRKAVASCPGEMGHCILLWYLQFPNPVPCWLQTPSISQTCPFLSRLGQSFSQSSPSTMEFIDC